MSNIFFKSVSFNKAAYSYSYVEGRVLNIVVDGVPLSVHFQSNAEAIDGLKELTDLLNGERATNQDTVKTNPLDDLVNKMKSGKVLNILNECNEKLNGVLERTKDTVSDKVSDAAYRHITSAIEERARQLFTDVEDRLKDLKDNLPDIDDVLNQAFSTEEQPKQEQEQPKPKPTVKTKRSFGTVEDVFGFEVTSSKEVKKEAVDTSEVLIGDMRPSELRAAIDVFVNDITSTERAQSMFNSIISNFDKETADEAMQAFKELIYNVAIQHEDKTLEQVLRENFQ